MFNANEHICHYTSYETAIKILETKELWATDSSCLDDRSEFRFLNEKYYDKLNNKKKKTENDEMDLNIIMKNLRIKEPYYTKNSSEIIQIPPKKVYLTSFSKVNSKRNELMYGNLILGRYFSNNTPWVGLVFNKTELFKQYEKYKNSFKENEDILPKNSKKIPFALLSSKILYIDPQVLEPSYSDQIFKVFEDMFKSQKEFKRFKNKEYFCSTFLEFKKKYWKSLVSNHNPDFFYNSLSEDERKIPTLLITSDILTKHIGFSQENEFRFAFCEPGRIALPKNTIHYDDNNGTPHLSISFTINCLTHIIIGPAPIKQQDIEVISQADIEKQLQEKLPSDHSIKINKSDIPWQGKNKGNKPCYPSPL